MITDLQQANATSPPHSDDTEYRELGIVDMFTAVNMGVTSAYTFTISPLICDQGTMITGLDGSFKSQISRHMAYALAAGWESWAGHAIVGGPRNVLVMHGDPGLREQVVANWRDIGAPLPNLHAMSGHKGWFEDATAVDALYRVIERNGIEVFVVDTLRSVLRVGANTNDSAPYDVILAFMTRLAGLGVVPVVVHHGSDTGEHGAQRGGTVTGSRAPRQWARHVVNVFREKNVNSGRAASLTVTKTNTTADIGETWLKAFHPDIEGPDRWVDVAGGRRQVGNRDGEILASVVELSGQYAEAKDVAAVIAERYGMKLKSIQNKLGPSGSVGGLLHKSTDNQGKLVFSRQATV